MSGSPPTALARELSENTAWLRRLARALVGDAAADDLVQDTLEVALRRAPESDRSIRPWLRTVLKNAAKMYRRSGERRERREELASTPPAPEAPDAIVAVVETQRRVVEAVLALDEPYRQTVMLRYVEELSAAEIARKLEVPAATIRSRLRRGLEMLRVEFDRQPDRLSWRLALAPFIVPGKVAPATGSIILGGLIMKVGIASVVVVFAVVVALAVGRDSESSPPSAEATPSEVERPAEPEPPKSGDETASPTPAKAGPRRFASLDERERFAASLARARQKAGERTAKSYDYSGVRLPASPPSAKKAEVPGKLDKDYIKERIHEVIPLVTECYDLALAENAALAGKLTVDFVIEAEEEIGGYVREAAVTEDSELADPGLSECVTETILSVEFIPPEEGGVVRVRYPFLFEDRPEE